MVARGARTAAWSVICLLFLALRRFVCGFGSASSRAAAAAEREDQVQCRAALEGVLFGGLVVGPVGDVG